MSKIVPEGQEHRLELRKRTEQRAVEELGLPFEAQPNPRCRHWKIYLLQFPTKAAAERADKRIKRWIREEASEKLARRRKRKMIRQSVRREIH
jgi:hypothetical protein